VDGDAVVADEAPGTVGPLKFGGTLAEKDSRGGGTGNHADALGVQQDSPVRISSG